jgi:hypothetical protein
MSAFTDCLVLCIEEIDNDYVTATEDSESDSSNSSEGFVIDKMYVIYDTIKNEYFICGKKQEYEDDYENINYTPYHFYCRKLNHVLNYISLTMENKINVTMYNFKNLSDSCDELNYYFLYQMSCEQHQISKHYDIEYVNDTKLKQFLKIIKHVKNDYVIL